MKTRHLLILGFVVVFVGVGRADIEMRRYDYSGGFTITGGLWAFYLQCTWPDASISTDAWSVADLGITPQQNHLFEIVGYVGSPFWIHPSYQSWMPIEVFHWSPEGIGPLLGVSTYALDGMFRADAGGPYRISEGESVLLDASGSYLAMQYGWNPAASLRPPTDMAVEWRIDGISVGSTITFDELVNTLGLSYGIHTLQLDATADYEGVIDYHETTFSTVEIIPEPGSLVLLGFGALLLRRRIR
jgi:hypothetical protein